MLAITPVRRRSTVVLPEPDMPERVIMPLAPSMSLGFFVTTGSSNFSIISSYLLAVAQVLDEIFFDCNLFLVQETMQTLELTTESLLVDSIGFVPGGIEFGNVCQEKMCVKLTVKIHRVVAEHCNVVRHELHGIVCDPM
jgi:hypothetical protein